MMANINYKLLLIINLPPQIFWYINDGRTATNERTLAGEIEVVQTNSNGIDLENKIIYIMHEVYPNCIHFLFMHTIHIIRYVFIITI